MSTEESTTLSDDSCKECGDLSKEELVSILQNLKNENPSKFFDVIEYGMRVVTMYKIKQKMLG